MPPAASDGPASSRATSARTPATSPDVTLQSGTLQNAAPARAKANRGNEAWRAEVATRVSNYRARQQQSGELFPGQDFSSPTEPVKPVAEAPAARENALGGNDLRENDSRINDVRINDLRINDTKPHEDAVAAIMNSWNQIDAMSQEKLKRFQEENNIIGMKDNGEVQNSKIELNP